MSKCSGDIANKRDQQFVTVIDESQVNNGLHLRLMINLELIPSKREGILKKWKGRPFRMDVVSPFLG